MARPVYRLSITRKDGKDITFKDYKGNEVTKKYCPIGALFPSKIDGGFSLVLERKVTLDPELVWVNVYPNEERASGDGEDAPAKRGGRRGAATAKAAADDMFGDELPD